MEWIKWSEKTVQHCTTSSLGWLDKPHPASHETKPEVLTAGTILSTDLYRDLILAVKGYETRIYTSGKSEKSHHKVIGIR